ncbi:MAG: hypothetical protein KC438_10485, partial [Thermomicrobiales bacterium]|nr:hypothetical protein [Thermomicrobiales bacterium]
AKRWLNRLLDEVDADGMKTDRIDAIGNSFDAMFAAVTAAPFFGSQRVIVLSGLLSQSSSKGGRGGRVKADCDLARLVAAVPVTTTLILFDPDLGELSQTLRKQLPDDIQISRNDAPRGQALVELTRQLAHDNGSKIDNGVSRQLLDRLFPAYWPQAPQNRAFDKPPSIEQLESEIAKLALAAYPEAITGELVADLIPQRTEERIFPLLDAVVGGNQRNALLETRNAQMAGEDASRTLAQIYQQVELAVAALAPGRPTDPLQAGKALGLANANRMRPVTQAAQRARVAPARQLRMALETDRKFKTGRLRNPDEALVDLVAGVTGPSENR